MKPSKEAIEGWEGWEPKPGDWFESGTLRGIIKEVEEYGLNRELILDRLRELDKDIEYVWKRKHNQEGPPSDFNLGYMGACWDIQGPEVEE